MKKCVDFVKKKINKLEEERKEILTYENRILLVENGKVTICGWETKMIKHNERGYVLHGKLLEDSCVVDTIFSNFINQKLYISLISGRKDSANNCRFS